MGASSVRRRTERRGLRLWPVGAVLVLTFAAVVLVAAAVFYTGWDLLGAQELRPERRIDSKTLFDLVKLSFGVVAGAGALVALVVAYRHQRVDEDGSLREDTRLHTERFTSAVSQLGDDSAAVRLGGVHALAGLADDAPTRALRQTCIDVLCAYLGLPYTALADLPVDDVEAKHAYLALRRVRHTVIRLVRDHLRLAPHHPHSWQDHDFDFTAVTFDGGDLTDTEFAGTVDFSSAVFRDGIVDDDTVDFTGTMFSGTVNFTATRFLGGTVNFTNAWFTDTASFARAQFLGGRVIFKSVQFSQGSTVDFANARFLQGTVDFANACFHGRAADFCHAWFHGGTVSFDRAEFVGDSVDFSRAKFKAGQVTFDHVRFSAGAVDFGVTEFSGAAVGFGEADFSGGAVSFRAAQLSDGIVTFRRSTLSDGTVTFNGARFSGATVDFERVRFTGGTLDFTGVYLTDGTVTFKESRFSNGTANFGHTQFDGSMVDFRRVEFSGISVSFESAAFSASPVDFTEAEFSGGTVNFDRASFSGGTVTFRQAAFRDGVVNFGQQFYIPLDRRFVGGTVDFSDAVGVSPSGLVPLAGRPLPPGLRLPSWWLPDGS